MTRPDVTPNLHFARTDLYARMARARACLQQDGLDALLLFAPESQYYLTGFDTNGYVFFQCAVMTADGAPITMLTRPPDVQTAWRTSIIEDVRVWTDAVDADPGAELRRLLEDKGLRGARVGIELATYGLTAANYRLVARALEGFCTLVDASQLVRALRVTKSPAEIAYVRRAAALADDALTAMRQSAGPGVFAGAISAAGQAVIFGGGGDPAASGPVLGSGDRALLVRNSTGARHLGARDQLTIEFAAVYRRYHACLMQTLPIGEDCPEQRHMYAACRSALDEARTWARRFVHWYNHEHRHSGIRYVTPAQRHAGADHAILAQRHDLYQCARDRNPRRWSRRTRNWEPVTSVMLNPERESAIPTAAASVNNCEAAA